MIYSRGKERHNIAAGTVSRVSPRVFKIRDGSPGKERRRRRRGRGGGGKGPTKGALLNDETSFRERKSGRARSLMLRSIGAFLLLCKPHRALPGHRVFLHRPL